MRPYDVILAGGGAAGLSLAYQLAQHPRFANARLLIIDEEVKDRNDHTWCSWLRGPEPFDEIAYRVWDRLAFIAPDFAQTFDLAPYRYRMVRAVDLYRHVRERLAPKPTVDFLLGRVERVVDGDARAEVHVNALTLTADWVFDSRIRASDYRPVDPRYHHLIQHFLGWEIESTAPVFDPEVPVFFDFRTPQNGAMRFVYVLPYDERHGLVEYTLFSRGLLPRADYEKALRAYIRDVLGADDVRLISEEQDLIPMTDRPFPRRAGRRVMNIGTRGGRVKASSGFAFHRIQQDSAAIVESLATRGDPFDVPQAPPRFHTFDAMLLDVLVQPGDLGARTFTALFRKNPIQRIFRFLDEETTWVEDLQVMASVPWVPFTKAWLNVKRRGV
ncbi:MAG: lycopene cyclase family protein [Anaerolineae bacterium]